MTPLISSLALASSFITWTDASTSCAWASMSLMVADNTLTLVRVSASAADAASDARSIFSHTAAAFC